MWGDFLDTLVLRGQMKLCFLCTRNGLVTDHVHEFDANKVQGKIKSYLVTDHMAGIYLDF